MPMCRRCQGPVRGRSESRTGTLGTVALERIAVAHDVMGGVPCMRGTRIPVATVVGMVADGMTVDTITSECPQLEADDVVAALRYAAQAVDVHELPVRLPG